MQADSVLSHSVPAIVGLVDFESGKLLSPDSIFTQTFVNRFTGAANLINEKAGHFKNTIEIIDRVLQEIDIELRDL